MQGAVSLQGSWLASAGHKGGKGLAQRHISLEQVPRVERKGKKQEAWKTTEFSFHQENRKEGRGGFMRICVS